MRRSVAEACTRASLYTVGALTRRFPRWRALRGPIWRLAALCTHLPPVWLEARRGALRLSVQSHQLLDMILFFNHRFYESEELEAVEKLVRSGDTVVDVGANIGVYSLVANQCVGAAGRVVSIECDPDTFGQLCGNLAMNAFPTADAVCCAVGAAQETVEIVRNPVSHASNRTVRLGESGARDALTCPSRPLSLVLADMGIGEIRLLKIDIEGSEIPVLERYFDDTPGDERPRFMLVEYNPVTFPDSADELMRLVIANGYEEQWRSSDWHFWTNVLLSR